MPDLIAITKRTQEIVLERFMRWHDDLKQQAQKAKDAPQREKRAAYEAMRATMGPEYDAARAAYDQQYGPEEFGRQVGLGIRRDERDGGV